MGLWATWWSGRRRTSATSPGASSSRSRILEPQPRATPYDGVDGELDGARQTQAPRRLGDRPREDAARCPCPREVFLQHVHAVSVSRNDQSVQDALIRSLHAENDCVMTNASHDDPCARRHRQDRHASREPPDRVGPPVRTAARHGADVRFDWDDPATHRTAVEGVDRIYLVPPVMRTRFAPQVSAFLDLAEAAGVQHITYLSAYGIDLAPPEVALRAVELDLMERSSMTHSIVRPAWFMQNFSETFLKPIDGAITVPTGDGAEASSTPTTSRRSRQRRSPTRAHAGAEYAPTGPKPYGGEAADAIGA